jgi:DNA-binding NarL/FixJ family response regulator
MILRLDVDRVVSGLPAELADLAHLLATGKSVVGVARRLEISRATVHRRVVRLRHIFREAGLDTYIDMQEAA